MAYNVFVGTKRELSELLNGSVALGPFTGAGLAVGALTLIFTTPAATVTFSGSAGDVLTLPQIIAEIKAQVGDLVTDLTPATGGYYLLSIRRDSGFTISSTGTANALLGLSTTADTVSAGEVGGSAIRAVSQGATDGYYMAVIDTSPNASPSDAAVVSDGGGSLSVDDGGGSLTVDTPQLPATVGTKVASASLSVVMASDDHLKGQGDALALAAAAEAANILSLGRYNAAAPALTDGQVVVHQLDASGALYTTSRLKGQGAALALASAAEAPNNIPLGHYNVTAPVLTDGQVVALQLDVSGFLKNAEQFAPGYEDNVNNVAWYARKPLASPSGAWSKAFNTAVATNVVGKAAPGLVRYVRGYIDGALATSTVYVMLIDAASAVNGAVTLLHAPIKIVHTTGAAAVNDDQFVIDLQDEGVYAATGIVVALSTTGGTTLTLAAAQMIATVLYK